MKRWGLGACLAFGLLGVVSEAAATCTDGVLDGSETDVDCGGTCAPCEHGLTCHTARDCESGRCAGQSCEERPYFQGDPVPPGYRVEYSTTDSSAIVRAIGLVAFGVGYAGAYVAALTLPGELSALYLPVLGPWIEVADGSQAKRGYIALDGAVQTVGFSLLIGGLITGGSQLLRDQEGAGTLQVSAAPSSEGGQVGLSGSF